RPPRPSAGSFAHPAQRSSSATTRRPSTCRAHRPSAPSWPERHSPADSQPLNHRRRMVSPGSVENPSRRSLAASAAPVLVALAVGCAAHGPGTAGDSSIAQVNVVPDFLAAWSGVRTSPRDEQLARTRQALLASHPELFGPEVFGPTPALDRDLERLLVEMP